MFLKTFSSRLGQIGRITISQNVYKSTRSVIATSKLTQSAIEQHNSHSHYNHQNKSTDYIWYASVPTFLAFFKKNEDEEDGRSFLESILPEEVTLLFKKLPEEDESQEGQLISVLKRTIICIQQGEYKKAEQMGHLALRMAQDMRSYDGVTMCYDIMGNLAYETNQYKKAEDLFVAVLQRLLQQGSTQDDIRVLHLSLKVAQMVEYQGKTDEAKTNYLWTITKLEARHKNESENSDLHELWGLANNYYGKFLLQNGHFIEAKNRLKTSYDIFLQTRGKFNPEFVDILNDLAVACLHVNELTSAEVYINEALIVAVSYPDMLETGIYHANKGLISLKKGLIAEATKMCKHAERLAKQSKHPEGMEQVKYCLDEIHKVYQAEKTKSSK